MPYYTSWLAETAGLSGTTQTNTNFLLEAPHAINYAEQRIIRDVDLSALVTVDFSQVTSPNVRTVPVPTTPLAGYSGGFTVINEVNLITPAGQTNPELGKRNPLEKTSIEVLDFIWPSSVGAQLPTRWAIPRFSVNLNQNTILLGAWPDAAYTVEYVGLAYPLPLSQSNQDTYISSFLTNLFLIATMIHFSAFKHNFGAQADNPAMAMSWEEQYKLVLSSVDAEEMRRRWMGTSVLPPAGSAKQAITPGAARGR